MRVLVPLFLSVILTCAGAQPGALRIPDLGFAYDAGSKTIRPIRGIPGAALLGVGVEVGLPLSFATASPTQDFAIAIAAEDSQPRLIRWSGDTISVLPLGGMTNTAPEVVFSPSGQSAVLAGDLLQVAGDLPTSPHLREVTPPMPGPWRAIAVSDDGEAVLLATGGDLADPVWLISGGQASLVAVPGSVAAMAFREQSREAIAITTTGDIYLIRANREVEVSQLLAGDERTAEPIAVYFARDGQRAYAVSRSGMVAVVDVKSASVAAMSCGCAPSGLAPLRSEGIFRITEISSGPVMLFDGRVGVPRAWFVPSDIPGRGQGREE